MRGRSSGRNAPGSRSMPPAISNNCRSTRSPPRAGARGRTSSSGLPGTAGARRPRWRPRTSRAARGTRASSSGPSPARWPPTPRPPPDGRDPRSRRSPRPTVARWTDRTRQAPAGRADRRGRPGPRRDASAAPEMDVRAGVRAREGPERQAEALAVGEREVVGAGDAHRPDLGVEPVGEGLTERVDAAADPAAGLQHDRLVAGPEELRRRHEPGHPGAHDHDPLGAPRPRRQASTHDVPHGRMRLRPQAQGHDRSSHAPPATAAL